MADTVTQLLHARADDDNLAITYEGTTWTWREYIHDAGRMAAALIERNPDGYQPHRRCLVEERRVLLP